MSELRDLCTSFGWEDVQTVLASGNVVFRAKRASAKQLEKALGYKVILRTEKELRDVVARNPLEVTNPGHLLVFFLECEVAADATEKLRVAYKDRGPEKFAAVGRELYVDYVNGQGRSKFTTYLIERTLGCAGTARNWNTVNRLLALTE